MITNWKFYFPIWMYSNTLNNVINLFQSFVHTV